MSPSTPSEKDVEKAKGIIRMHHAHVPIGELNCLESDIATALAQARESERLEIYTLVKGMDNRLYEDEGSATKMQYDIARAIRSRAGKVKDE